MDNIAENKKTLKIRNLPAHVVAALDAQARERKISREEYIRRLLINLAAAPETKEVENKYVSLVERLTDIIEMNIDTMERMEFMMERMMQGKKE